MTLLLDERTDAVGDALPPASALQVPSDLPTIRIGSHRYPLMLPKIRDSRLHVAAVVMTIHTLGQTVLDFRVSVVQIFAAIFTCFVIEVGVVFARERIVRWPASAMLTGSGVGLIMRLPDMEANTPWSTSRWWMYSAVAGLSLVTKYVIRDRGRPVFNPSNLGLVFVFVVLGSHFAEPLDFWWAPVDAPMLFAYAVILVGGSLVTKRIGLLPMAGAFWATLAIGLGAIAVSGHSIYSPASLHPVTGWHFWWLVLTSPETLIFVYFMLSDPKTVPQTRRASVLFGFSVAFVATMLIAIQRTEFGTKVALLGALTICSVLRALSAHRPDVTGRLTGTPPIRSGGIAAAALGVCSIVIVGIGPRSLGEVIDGNTLPAVPSAIPKSGLAFRVAVSREARRFDPTAADQAQLIGEQLVRILATERESVRVGQPAWVASVASGRRRKRLLGDFDRSSNQPIRTAAKYSFTSLELVVVPSRSEGANRLGLAATGSVSETEFSSDGTVTEVDPHEFRHLFILRKATDRYLLADEVEQVRARKTFLQ